MRMFLVSLVTITIWSGCAAGMLGVSETDVIKQVSFDKTCPQDKVRIANRLIGSGTGSYKVDACGNHYEYRHAGTVVFEKGKGPAGTEGM